MAKNNKNFRNNRDERNFERKSYDSFNKKASYNRTFEKKPSNVTRTMSLGASPFYNEKIDQLVDFLNAIPFDKISIQVTMPKSVVYGNDEVKGFIVVGYIQSFSVSEGFKVTILNKYVDLIDSLTKKTIGVKIRTERETGDIKMITAFAVEPGVPVDLSFEEMTEEETAEPTVDVTSEEPVTESDEEPVETTENSNDDVTEE